MGDSPILNTIKNVAGYGVGTLAALDTIKGGGLGSYLMNRQRLMSDPGFRSTLAGSPFMAGVFGVSGATGPPPAPPPPGAYPAIAGGGGVVQPADMVGPPPPGVQVAQPGMPVPTAQNVPGYMPGTPRAWAPNLPPYDPGEAIQQQALASQQIAIGAGNPLQAGIAKMQAGIMPSPQETGAVLKEGTRIQREAGMGSTVGVKLPGMTVQIGSPYNIAPLGEEEFASPEQARAAATAHGPGWSIGPTVHGGWRPIPPPTREQELPMTPPPPARSGEMPGTPPAPVMRGGTAAPGAPTPLPVPGPQANRIDPYASAFTNAADAYGHPHGLLNSIAEHESSFNPSAQGPVLPEGDRAQGLMQFRPATAQQYGVDPTDPNSSIGGAARYLRKLVDENGGNYAAALQQYGGGPHYPVADILARADQYRGAIDQAPAAQPAAPPPPPPAPAPPPLSAPAERGAAYAAEPPPGAKVITPPAPAFDPNDTVPHVLVPAPAPADATVGYPPAAPGPAPGVLVPQRIPTLQTPAPPAPPGATGPPGAAVLPGANVDPATGLPLAGRTYESKTGSETFTAPPRGDDRTQMLMRKYGITDWAQASAKQITDYMAEDRALKIQDDFDKAAIARTQRAPSAEEARISNRYLTMKRNYDDFITQYPNPEDRAKFLGLASAPWQRLQEMVGWRTATAIRDFRNSFGPFSFESLTDDKGKPQLGFEEIAQVAPSASDSAPVFESNLQHFGDLLNDQITLDANTATLPVGARTPAVMQSLLDQLRANRDAARQSGSPPPAEAPAAPPSPPTAAAAPPPPAAAPAEPWTPNWVH
jgi:hypothetical protein